MNLIHYAYDPIEAIGAVTIPRMEEGCEGFIKPSGLWFAPDDDWKEASSNFRDAKSYAHEYRVEIKKLVSWGEPNPDLEGAVLMLKTPEQAAAFFKRFRTSNSGMRLHWDEVAVYYGGIFIDLLYCLLPLPLREELDFIYAWDVRGGCIWNPACIELIDVKTGQPVPKVETYEHPRFQVLDKPPFVMTKCQASFRPTGSKDFQIMNVTSFSMSPDGWSIDLEPVESK